MKKERGFTLAELLIVVAIIGVLVAISIPIFSTQLHKARVATDWANLRSYYSEIQADYIATGKKNEKVPTAWYEEGYDWHSITMLNGQKIRMKDGICAVSWDAQNGGYQIEYECSKRHPEHHLSLKSGGVQIGQ